MYNYLYSLESYSGAKSRFVCPNCNKVKSFTRYINNSNGEYLSPLVGRCNRIIKCGYHYKPKDYFLDKGLPFNYGNIFKKKLSESISPKKASCISPEIVHQSMKAYLKNHFVIYLNKLFGKRTQEIISKYWVGTCRCWTGAAVFWQVDKTNQFRTGKVILYDPVTGKRLKGPEIFINWAHRILKQNNYHLQQCLFGEHLLAIEPNKTVAVVESEKSAIIASAFFPDYIWLASGGLDQLTEAKCKVLKDREVVLIPDLGGFDNWQKKATAYNDTFSALVSDVLERIATNNEREAGLDIADFLIDNRWRELKFLPGRKL